MEYEEELLKWSMQIEEDVFKSEYSVVLGEIKCPVLVEKSNASIILYLGYTDAEEKEVDDFLCKLASITFCQDDPNGKYRKFYRVANIGDKIEHKNRRVVEILLPTAIDSIIRKVE